MLSGVVLLVVAVLPATDGGDRLWMGGVGVAFIVYGVFVAQQDSGTWVFPAAIFLIPVGAAIYAVWKTYERLSTKETTPPTPLVPPSGPGVGDGSAAPGGPGDVPPSTPDRGW